MSNFANPEQDLYSRRIILPSGTSTAPSIVFANDLTQGFYYDVDAGMIKATGFDGGGGGGGATTSLDNLVSVAINADLIPDSPHDIGSNGSPWNAIFTNSINLVQINFSNNSSFFENGSDAGIKSGGANFDFYNGANVQQLNINGGRISLGSNGSAVEPAITFISDPTKGVFGGTNLISIATNSQEVARFDSSATAGETRFMLWDVDSNTLQRVTVGAADSGGTGFKVLRIPN